MRERGQVLQLKTTGADGRPLWAYRYRPGGRNSKRMQRGGFASAEAARMALGLAIERAERRQFRSRRITLSELVDEYLAGARAIGVRPNARPASRRYAVSTICATPSPRRRSVPDWALSSCRAH